MHIFAPLCLCLTVVCGPLHALNYTPTSKALIIKQGEDKDFYLGKFLKNILEKTHFSKSQINDKKSAMAFDQLIKRLDFRKQFFINKDITALSNFKLKLDDEFNNGMASYLFMAHNLLSTRIDEAERFTSKAFAKGFDFKLNESLETDYEKRKFTTSRKEWENRWRKTLKYNVLNEVIVIEGEQKAKLEEHKKELKNKKKKKKAKKYKKMTAAEIKKKAIEEVKKDYEGYFRRLKNLKRIDKLSNFANAMAQAFDPHTTYLPPMEIEDFNINMAGKLEGIGAVLSQDGPYTKVERIVPGSPSWKQKELKPGDVILKVGQAKKEPENIVGMDLRDAVRLIRGKKGTEVRLTIRKPDSSNKIVPIIRDVVELEEGYAKGAIIEHKDLKKKFGYISLPSFYRDFHPNPNEPTRNCTDDVKKILTAMNAQGVNGIILDLRNNSGGSLPDSVNMAGLFFKKGPVVQVKDFEGNIKVLADIDSQVFYKGPVIIMQNLFSASASEILAGALKDYNRAIVVGSGQSHGKGTVQTIIDLDTTIPRFLLNSLFGSNRSKKKQDSLGALKLTIQQFYRINGSSTQKKGVKSDIVFPEPMGFLDTGEQHLDFALDWDKVGDLNVTKRRPYTLWSDFSIDKKKLRSQSQKRTAKNKKFKLIKERIQYMTKLTKKTLKTLNLAKIKQQRKREEMALKRFKNDEINKKIVVGKTIQNELFNKNIQKKDLKRFREAEEARHKDFVEKIQKDPYIEETLFILKDASTQIASNVAKSSR